MTEGWECVEPALSEYMGLGGLGEEEALALALEIAHRVRSEATRTPEGPAPSPEKVHKLIKERGERHD